MSIKLCEKRKNLIRKWPKWQTIYLDYDFSIHDPNLDIWVEDDVNLVFIKNGEPNRIGATLFPTNIVLITLSTGVTVNGTITDNVVEYTDVSGNQEGIMNDYIFFKKSKIL